MATDRNFQAMLNEYLPNSLLSEEMIKRDYFLQNAEKDNTWLGGSLIVPFVGARASTVKFGGLTASGEIGQTKAVRGEISSQPEVWGSLIFQERDLMEHGKISEQNLIKLLPDEIDLFLDYLKMVVSLSFTNSSYFAKATGNGDASGNMIVDRPERLVVGQKVIIDDDNSSAVTGFVNTVNMDTGEANFVTTRFGSTAVDLSGYTTAQNAALYFDGHETSANRLTSLKNSLLSAANGGSSTLYGQTKLAYPYLQAINGSGASITATNILTQIFDFVIKLRNRGAPKANKIVLSYKHWGSIMKILETDKGSFRQASDMKASEFGWDEVEIGSPRGKLTIVATQEMDDDWIGFIDMSAIKIYSNGFFKKRQDPDGKEYFTIRGETGYQYIVDVCFFGDLVLERPSRCGILHTISY
jgi:hypothetical protein